MLAKHSVRLNADEARSLAELVGRPLERVDVDIEADYAIQVWLHAAEVVVELFPLEVSTPSSVHPYGDIERPAVLSVSTAGTHPSAPVASSEGEALFEELRRRGLLPDEAVTEQRRTTVAADLGTVEQIDVLASVAWLSPPVAGEPLEVLGATIPGGTDYSVELMHPRLVETPRAAARLGGGTLIDVDAALVIRTRRKAVTVSCSGYSLQVSVGRRLPKHLRGVVDAVPLSARQ